jgi:Calcineurin-like phosphoesterase
MIRPIYISCLVSLALFASLRQVEGQTNVVFLETMATNATSLWLGDDCNYTWIVTGNSFNQSPNWNYGSGNPCGMQFKQGTANLSDSMMTAASGVAATGTSGFVEFWIRTSGLTPNTGWDFQLNAGSGFVTRLSELSGTNHNYQLYHYDLLPNELVSNLNLRFQFAGGASTNRVDLDYISVSVVTAASSTNTTFNGSLILGRPTADSIAINALATTNLTAYFEYGTQSNVYTGQTPVTNLFAGQPLEVVLSSLSANTRYYYRLRFQLPGGTTFLADTEHTFMTQRPPGSTFTFCIHGDSHPERTNTMYNADFYALTLSTAAADNPDFYMTIGDDFSVDNIPTNEINQASVTYRYTLQRQYLGLVGANAPVFLVNGNHEEASRWAFLNTNLVAPGYSTVTFSNVAAWAQIARNQFYSEPAPDSFYSGMTNDTLPGIGSLRSCYAWTWGDALFVTLDPYWYSTNSVDTAYAESQHPNNNTWLVTHGDPQYFWLKQTLEQSQAKYKFVFAHHVMGTGRGGIEEAVQYEWGGQNVDGTWGFTTNRPNWPLTIHELFVSNNVTIFFQGHDHLFVRQQLDGVTYQELPNPADPNYSLFNSDAYTDFIFKTNNTGYTRVTVSPTNVKVDYVRTILPTNELPNGITNNAPTGVTNGTVTYSYTIPAAGLLTSAIATNNVALQWSGNSELNYVVQWSSDLMTWSNVFVGQTNTWTDTNPVSTMQKKFYRLMW